MSLDLNHQPVFINYDLGIPGHVFLRIYDMPGNEVTVLVHEWQPEGKHEAIFDGSGLAPGIYYYILQTAEGVQSGKLVLVR